MANEHPQGSVVGLCAASATCFAICSAFLGLWGFQGSGTWSSIDLLVLLPLALGSLSLSVTPFIATRPKDGSLSLGRACFLTGVLLVWLAICVATILSLTGAGGLPKI